MTELDVVEVNFTTKAVRVIATNKSARNADAIVNMAVMRRGIEEGYYTTTPAGRFQDGDTFFPEEGEDYYD